MYIEELDLMLMLGEGLAQGGYGFLTVEGEFQPVNNSLQEIPSALRISRSPTGRIFISGFVTSSVWEMLGFGTRLNELETSNFGTIWDLAATEQFLYAAAQNGLWQLRIDDPDTPDMSQNLNATRSWTVEHVQGSLFVVTNDDGNMHLLDGGAGTLTPLSANPWPTEMYAVCITQTSPLQFYAAGTNVLALWNGTALQNDQLTFGPGRN